MQWIFFSGTLREQSKKFEISFLRIKLLWDKQSFLFLNVDDCEGWFWWKWQLISSHPWNIMSSQPRIHKQGGYFFFNYLKGKEYSRVFMNLMWKRHSHFPLYLPSVFIYIYIYNFCFDYNDKINSLNLFKFYLNLLIWFRSFQYFKFQIYSIKTFLLIFVKIFWKKNMENIFQLLIKFLVI